MRRILLLITMVLLMMSGCAQKTLSTGENRTGADTTYGAVGAGDGTTIYQNVDPNANGVYGMGRTGSGGSNNGTYDNNTPYANRGGIENIYFDVDQYSITSEKLPIISNNARMLKNDVAQGGKIRLEGNCDATGSDEYNYALGLRRAKATKDALVMQGINPSSIILVSMGESSPECTTSTSSDCYAKNRRVEFKVVQ